MSSKYDLIRNEVLQGRVRIESAFVLAKLERDHIRKGEATGVDLDVLRCGRFGLSARESMFAYLMACSETSKKESPVGYRVSRQAGGKLFSLSASDIAIQCGFNASAGDELMSNRKIRQAIKEYRLQRLRTDDSPSEDLRSIALSRLASSASANVDSLVEYESERTDVLLEDGQVPEDNYYGYIPMAGGSMVRIKQLNEIPDHVGLAIKSFKIRNEGTKEIPILVPDIEFYDGVRAAELLLKYTGDIGNKSSGEDVAGAVRDIVGMIDGARRRNNERKGKSLEAINAIDVEFGGEVENEEEEGVTGEVYDNGEAGVQPCE